MVIAHGIGGRQDLPIPLEVLMIGAALAVLASFAALGLTWQRSKFRADAGRPVPAWLQAFADSRVTRTVLRLVGVLGTLATIVAAAFGPSGNANPAPWTVYVIFWVGLVFASLAFGPVWKLLNPLRAVHRGIALLSGGKPLARYPAGLGYWPAAVGLLAFTWMELVAPDRVEGWALLTWFSIYAAVMIVGSTVFGTEFFDKADPFEVYSSFIGRMAPIGRHEDGHLVFRNPFDGLVGLRPAPGLVAVLCVMLGSTAYDGFTRSPWWVGQVQDGPLPPTLMSTLGMFALVLIVAVTYWLCTYSAGPGGPGELAHSLIPIAVGYLIAHYFSLFFYSSQSAFILWSDPFGTNADYLGVGDFAVNFELLPVWLLAVVRAGAVVAGHIFGVFSAHDRAVALLPTRRALTGQLPLLLLMVFYTVGGLFLLFAT
ncbi:hypothetical protein LO762_04360 [Actinocorallia sp. API 0066]|uniref:hypothetical protein n=1 Tax=Actinocorallia sp. API 0066 TaxID=2896846 RepID=UPI001E60E8DE|nr:hypothetical protein [Actinocorallia sp. API 0066]MCD0448433.1 hypothetical protein [Actinocorallia sp. API 0066]